MIRSAGRTSIKAAKGHFGAGLRGSASVLALGAMFSGSAAWAQPADSAAQPADSAAQPAAAQPVDDQAIVVTGIRASLANSQNIKRNSDTVVDAITAQDIGALPDRSVTEALQRIPGVSMNRFAGSNDPDHFSVEGSGVVIRGLSFVRSEFNGRDTFSTGVYGQAINFSDVPAELLGSVAVYKNATAEMIEGGLSGTVDLRTRLPFDNRGFHISFDAEANYGDFARRWAPTGSLLISNTWDTGIGRIGLLADVSYSRLYSRADGIQISNFQTRNNTIAMNNSAGSPATLCRNALPSGVDTSTLPGGGTACGTASTAGADGLADMRALSYAPLGGQFRTQDYDRTRFGIAAAAQWESLDHRAHLTAQYLRTDSKNNWNEHTFEAGSDLAEYNTYPAGCHQNGNSPDGRPRAECRINGSGQFVFSGNDRGSGYPAGTTAYPNYQYGDDNIFESGFITLPGSGWRSASSGSPTTRVPTGGMQNTITSRSVREQNVVSDYGLNFRFDPNEHWSINVDAQHVRARHDTLDMSVMGSNFSDQEVDISGGLPVVIPHKPLTLSATWASPNPAMAAQNDAQYFGDRQWEFWRSAMDHIEHSTGQEWAFQGDVAYNFDEGSFLRRIKFGARYSDRDQTVRYTTYNWGALSEVWAGSSAVYFDQAGQGASSFYNFDNFFRGQTNAPPGGYYYDGSLTRGYAQASTLFKSIGALWNANGAGQPNTWRPLSERAGVVPGTDFLPSEIQSVDERNYGAYLMLSFGNDEPIFGNVRLNGNIGVRYVDTRLEFGRRLHHTERDHSRGWNAFCGPMRRDHSAAAGASGAHRSRRDMQYRADRLRRARNLWRNWGQCPEHGGQHVSLLAAEPEFEVRAFPGCHPALRRVARAGSAGARGCSQLRQHDLRQQHEHFEYDGGEPVPQTGALRPVRPHTRMVFRPRRLSDLRRLLQAHPQRLLPGGHPALDHQQRCDGAIQRSRSGQFRRHGHGQGFRSRLSADPAISCRACSEGSASAPTIPISTARACPTRSSMVALRRIRVPLPQAISLSSNCRGIM